MSNSIGDLRNSGLQGNNFPWQLRVLQGLQAIANATNTPLTCTDQITLCNNGNPVDPTNPLPNALYDLSGNAITSTFIPDTGQYALDVNIVTNTEVRPVLIESINDTGDLTGLAGNKILSISFAARGSTGSDISVDGGTTYIRLLPGETLNLDANGVMNWYDPTAFFWDTTIGANSNLLIAFNFI